MVSNLQEYFKFLRKQKIATFKNFDEIQKKNLKFDIIMHFFVLEHIQDPLKFLQDQLNQLNKNGKIIFEILNIRTHFIQFIKLKNLKIFIGR